MASSVKNQGGKPTKLTRGFAANLGTIALNGDVVAFTVPEPSRDHQGNVVIQVGPGLTGTPNFALEISIDGAQSWAVLAPTVSLSASGQPGSDTAALFEAQYNVSGFGGGAQFRFGLTTAPTGGSSAVWALVG